MEARAEADGDVFLPNPTPERPVEYVLICMEPSPGPWARTPDEGKSRVKEGFRNLLSSLEDFILHLCARRFPYSAVERYHITDLSKGAMLVDHAGLERVERYDGGTHSWKKNSISYRVPGWNCRCRQHGG